MAPLYNLLIEPVFSVQQTDGSCLELSLPGVLAGLSSGQDLTFVRLRPHQRPAWHAFLVQLAYLALEATEQSSPVTPGEWVSLLRGAAGDEAGDAAWSLLNPDWQQPAFMQSPCSAAYQADFKRGFGSVQDIDLLVTSRHHDEKGGKQPIDAAEFDSLVYALVGLQGWSPFLGAGNYGTMRMNGGVSSRPQFRLAFERGSGAEFLRDLSALREPASMERLEDQVDADGAAGFASSTTAVHKLLWLVPWNRGALPIAQVHPYALEVCRRVRLVDAGGRLQLLRAGSDAMRVDAKSLRGAVLDPWVALIQDAKGVKALTAQPHSFGYRSFQSLWLDRSKTTLPLLANVTNGERRTRVGQSATLIAQVLVSAEGGTDGLLTRELVLPPEVRERWASDDAQLGLRSRRFVEIAGIAVGKVLRPALFTFVGGTEKADFQNRDFARVVDPWVARFEVAIDEAFFPELFGTFELSLDDNGAQAYWARSMRAGARRQFFAATQSLPTRDVTRLFADVQAEGFLEGAIRKHLVPLFATSDSEAMNA